MTTEPTQSAESANQRLSFDQVAGLLARLEHELRALETEMSAAIEAVPSTHRESAKNLVHYVALRQRDLRTLQAELAERGLSSLGRSESCVMGGLLEVAARAHESLAVHEHGMPVELERLTGAPVHDVVQPPAGG